MATTHRRILLTATGVLLLASACGGNGGKTALVEQAMEVYFSDETPNAECVRDALGDLSESDLKTLVAPLTEDELSLESADEYGDVGSDDPPQIQAIIQQCIGSEEPVDMVPAPE